MDGWARNGIEAADKLLVEIKVSADKKDYEKAHSCEDSLMLSVVALIAGSSTDRDAVALCRKALESQDIIFERWCA